MEEQIPEAVKAERVRRLIALGDELAKRYHERFLGAEADVLLEERQPDGSVMAIRRNTSTCACQAASREASCGCAWMGLRRKECMVRLWNE